ncbi:alkylmercury lyase family protein [Mycobacteroides salmoniphilum]|uniref:alkylmercury lyase family protein n=1 Tax=Mycobacteroides salmoniphilum TaxID=404941 RepID=UPI0010650AA9|nr:alkylmercury lyase family protein [Mycobacteroides salmoniphilum]TDZ81809.1 Alkylmercury lyase [Mycobacteroides salmoniphilum]TDZ89309.1 Alkylmercury lyase [Mycobacteroides salmoniphilum]
MNLEILQVPDCPNVQLLEERIAAALAGEQIAVTITHRVVNTPEEAEAHRMAGSPTLLVDGQDLFGERGLSAGLSCRLYPGPDGGFQGAPSVGALRAALQRHVTGEVVLAGLIAWRGGARPAGPIERAVHRAILRGFAETGSPPRAAQLAEFAAGVPLADVLDSLQESDVIQLDDMGRISSAYPFSGIPTAHRVTIDGDVGVYAMCAVDALGISAMLGGRHIGIASADPRTGDPITVAVRGPGATAVPDSTAVFLGLHTGEDPSADTCCTLLNFFTDSESARRWADQNPQVTGLVIDVATATQCGAAIFGSLLAD